VKLARVVGTVVSTIHDPVVEGRRLLVCEYLDERQQPTGEDVLALDAVDAGAGELVLVLDEGSSARQILGAVDAPVRAVVAAVVDAVEASPSGTT